MQDFILWSLHLPLSKINCKIAFLRQNLLYLGNTKPWVCSSALPTKQKQNKTKKAGKKERRRGERAGRKETGKGGAMREFRRVEGVKRQRQDRKFKAVGWIA